MEGGGSLQAPARPRLSGSVSEVGYCGRREPGVAGGSLPPSSPLWGAEGERRRGLGGDVHPQASPSGDGRGEWFSKGGE